MGARPGAVEVDDAAQQVGSGTYPFVVMIVIAAVVWYVLEFTPLGRRIYATGGNAEAARLAGVRTGRVVVISLVPCAVISAVVGVMLASRLGTGDPTSGPSFLLPAFSAVFLGGAIAARGVGTAVLVKAFLTYWVPWINATFGIAVGQRDRAGHPDLRDSARMP